MGQPAGEWSAWEPTIDLRFERRIDGVRIINILQRRFRRWMDGGERILFEDEWRDIPVVDSPEAKEYFDKGRHIIG